jgi:hypothetical protein
MLHDAMRGFLGLGRLAAGSAQPDVLRLYDSVSIAKQHRTVRASVLIPADLVDKLVAGDRF